MKDFLAFEIFKGNEWLAIDQYSQAIRAERMTAFKTKEEAENYIQQHTRAFYEYALVPLKPLQNVLASLEKFLSTGLFTASNIYINLDKIKTQNMIQENLEYLQQNVKYMGFGDKLHDAIAKNMEQGVPDFTLKADALFNNKKIEGELSFRKSDNSDMYFFNRYKASMGQGDDARSQTFYIDNGKGITFKEAFNLLEGRAVHKELTNKDQEKYNAWVQLDFDKIDKHQNYELKLFTEGYGYDMDKVLKALPIKELQAEDSANKLLASLEKGNVQSVTMLRNGGEEKMFIEAAPQYKTINVYDAQMKPLSKEQKQELAQGKQQGPTQKDDSLLQKKRVSNNKGMSVT